jgi:soluble lytic murein transglycosylase-like protein
MKPRPSLTRRVRTRPWNRARLNSPEAQLSLQLAPLLKPLLELALGIEMLDAFDQVVQQTLNRVNTVDARPAPSWATGSANVRPASLQCFHAAAKRQGLEPIKILAVLRSENGRLGSFVFAPKGSSWDLGPMQINTIHLEDFSRVFGVPPGRMATLLAYDGCFNLEVAAYLLRKRTNEADGDFWRGIGRYHSKTPTFANVYMQTVKGHMQGIAKEVNQLAGANVVVFAQAH